MSEVKKSSTEPLEPRAAYEAWHRRRDKWLAADVHPGPSVIFTQGYMEGRAEALEEQRTRILAILDKHSSIEGIYNWGEPLREIRVALNGDSTS